MKTTLANKLTILRILLIPFFLISLINPIGMFTVTFGDKTYNSIALIIFFFAMFTDVLDGFIARTKQQKSTLGTFLDPLADKLFLFSGFIILTFLKEIPSWVTILVVSRDVLIVLGWLMIFVTTGKHFIVPSVFGKFTTFFQTLTILAVLLRVSHTDYIWNIAAVFTVISAVDYTVKGVKRINSEDIKK